MWVVDDISLTKLPNSPCCPSSLLDTGVAKGSDPLATQQTCFVLAIPFVQGHDILWLELYCEFLDLSMLYSATGRVRPD